MGALRDAQPLFLFVVGSAVGGAVLFGDWLVSLVGAGDPFARTDRANFVALAKTQLWLSLVAAQVGVMAVLARRAVPTALEVWRDVDKRQAGLRILALAVIVWLFVLAANQAQKPPPFPGERPKLWVITGLGFVACVPALLTLWGVRGGLDRLGAGIEQSGASEAPPTQAFLRLYDLAQRALLVLGTIIGGAILGAGAQRNAMIASTNRKDDFPLEYVLLYGLFFSVMLAVVYMPTYERLQSTGDRIVERYASLGALSDESWSDDYVKRRQLIELLRLEVTLPGSLKAGAAILAPLTSSLLASLLPGK